jgi:hypothetical protein
LLAYACIEKASTVRTDGCNRGARYSPRTEKKRRRSRGLPFDNLRTHLSPAPSPAVAPVAHPEFERTYEHVIVSRTILPLDE